jgi:hypothetical protein
MIQNPHRELFRWLSIGRIYSPGGSDYPTQGGRLMRTIRGNIRAISDFAVRIVLQITVIFSPQRARSKRVA